MTTASVTGKSFSNTLNEVDELSQARLTKETLWP